MPCFNLTYDILSRNHYVKEILYILHEEIWRKIMPKYSLWYAYRIQWKTFSICRGDKLHLAYKWFFVKGHWRQIFCIRELLNLGVETSFHKSNILGLDMHWCNSIRINFSSFIVLNAQYGNLSGVATYVSYYIEPYQIVF